jgi:hypothetical protein
MRDTDALLLHALQDAWPCSLSPTLSMDSAETVSPEATHPGAAASGHDEGDHGPHSPFSASSRPGSASVHRSIAHHALPVRHRSCADAMHSRDE